MVAISDTLSAVRTQAIGEAACRTVQTSPQNREFETSTLESLQRSRPSGFFEGVTQLLHATMMVMMLPIFIDIFFLSPIVSLVWLPIVLPLLILTLPVIVVGEVLRHFLYVITFGLFPDPDVYDIRF